MTATPNPRRVALWCLSQGWHIHLLAPGLKIPPRGCDRCYRGPANKPNPDYIEHSADDCPCIPAGRWCHGVRAATNNPATVNRWFEQLPGAGVAVALLPSRLLILDIDCHDAPHPENGDYLPGVSLPDDVPAGSISNGWDSIALLCEIRNAPFPTVAPATMCVSTPRGGVQVWYGVDEPDRWRQSASRLGWQIDVKAGWSYGICPGTVTPHGPYRAIGETRSVASLPSWLAADLKRTGHYVAPEPEQSRPSAKQLLARIQRPKGTEYVTAAIRAEVERVANAKNGQRNDTVNAAARALGRFIPAGHVTETEIEELLVTAAISAGLPAGEARSAVRSGIRIGITKGRAA